MSAAATGAAGAGIDTVNHMKTAAGRHQASAAPQTAPGLRLRDGRRAPVPRP